MEQLHVSKEKVSKKGCNKVKKERKKPVKWRDRPLKELIPYVQDFIVNPYIRLRDQINFGKCISCNGPITQAGHRYPRSTHKGMCFNIQNIHGQEISCNHFKGGNLDEYDKGLINRHGQAYLGELRQMEREYKARKKKSFDRFDVLLIAETYLYLTENKIWIFRQKEFDKLKVELITKS